jgi:hypothetical protein
MKITEAKTWAVATSPPHKFGAYWMFLKLTINLGVGEISRLFRKP